VQYELTLDDRSTTSNDFREVANGCSFARYAASVESGLKSEVKRLPILSSWACRSRWASVASEKRGGRRRISRCAAWGQERNCDLCNEGLPSKGWPRKRKIELISMNDKIPAPLLPHTTQLEIKWAVRGTRSSQAEVEISTTILHLW